MAKKRLEAKFTQEWLKNLAIPAIREEWFDSGCRGLTVRIGSSGKKIFYFFARVHGKLTRLRIGEHPDMPLAEARREIERLRGDAAKGQAPKPRIAEARDELTLEDLFGWYMRTHAKLHKRTWKEDEARFKRVLLHWSNRRLSTITTAMVKDLHTEIGTKQGPYAGNKMLELLGFMWRLGQEQLKFDAPDPTKGIIRFDKHERERFIEETEIVRFFDAVDNLRQEISRDFILLCLFTGARRSNVAAMRWEDIKMETATWTIKRQDSKNKTSMRIVLPSLAMEILNRRKQTSTSPWVLPSARSKTGHYVEPKGAMNSIRKTAGLTDIRLHDLRRTLGSWQANQGKSLQIIGKSLGHTSIRSTQIYARLMDDPVRESVELATTAMISAKSKKSEK